MFNTTKTTVTTVLTNLKKGLGSVLEQLGRDLQPVKEAANQAVQSAKDGQAIKNTQAVYSEALYSLKKAAKSATDKVSAAVAKASRYTLKVDVTGFKKENLTVDVLGNATVRVSGALNNRTFTRLYTFLVPAKRGIANVKSTVEGTTLLISYELKKVETVKQKVSID